MGRTDQPGSRRRPTPARRCRRAVPRCVLGGLFASRGPRRASCAWLAGQAAPARSDPSSCCSRSRRTLRQSLRAASRPSTPPPPKPRCCSRPSSGSGPTPRYLGPLVVALLVGPLDVVHWEQRSFVRMAYNAGNRGLATLAAVATFAGANALLGTSTPAWVVTVLLSASAFTLVDDVVSVVLLRLHGERYRTAVSHVFGIDLLMMPVALVGAATGILAGEVGWWATVLALLPAAFVPELVIARARVRAATVRDLAALLGVIAILTTVALVTPIAATATLAVLCVLAVLLGIEVAPGDGALVPPLLAMVVIPACAVLDDDRVRVGAVVVAVVATATSWWCARDGGRTRVLARVGDRLRCGPGRCPVRPRAAAHGRRSGRRSLQCRSRVRSRRPRGWPRSTASSGPTRMDGAGHRQRRRGRRRSWRVTGLEGALVVTGLAAAALVGLGRVGCAGMAEPDRTSSRPVRTGIVRVLVAAGRARGRRRRRGSRGERTAASRSSGPGPAPGWARSRSPRRRRASGSGGSHPGPDDWAWRRRSRLRGCSSWWGRRSESGDHPGAQSSWRSRWRPSRAWPAHRPGVCATSGSRLVTKWARGEPDGATRSDLVRARPGHVGTRADSRAATRSRCWCSRARWSPRSH